MKKETKSNLSVTIDNKESKEERELGWLFLTIELLLRGCIVSLRSLSICLLVLWRERIKGEEREGIDGVGNMECLLTLWRERTKREEEVAHEAWKLEILVCLWPLWRRKRERERRRWGLKVDNIDFLFTSVKREGGEREKLDEA